MATIKSVIEKARAEQYEERLCKFHDFLIDQFGGPLLIGDIIDVPIRYATHNDLLYMQPSGCMQLIVYGQSGQIKGSAHIAIPLMLAKYNTPDICDIDNNYVLGYTASRLKKAKWVGHQQLIVRKECIGFYDVKVDI